MTKREDGMAWAEARFGVEYNERDKLLKRDLMYAHAYNAALTGMLAHEIHDMPLVAAIAHNHALEFLRCLDALAEEERGDG